MALLFFIVAREGGAQNAAKSLVVYYMPWYTAKPYSEHWGWHWTMEHFDPDTFTPFGDRQIASWYYPLIGPYDSLDPAVLEYHVLLMKLAGIEGVIVDWYGAAGFLDYGSNNAATLKLFQYTRKAGLKLGICYEDQTIPRMIEAKYITAAEAVSHAQQDMLYLERNFFADPSYLRFKGRPVLLNFGPQYFATSNNWNELFSVLQPTNQPAFFTEDNRLAPGLGAFSWPPMWLSQVPGTGGVLSGAALKEYLADFDQKAAAWPAFISSAFPRFHDIYQRAGARKYFGYLGDRHGETLRETLMRGLTNNSAFVQIVTWNDFGEGSMVEPTREFGYRDLGIIQDLRKQYLDAGFERTTNDLPIALKFYKMRKQTATDSPGAQELDRVFDALINGDIAGADADLNRLAAAQSK